MPVARAADGAPLHYAVHDFTDPWRKAPAMLLLHGFGRSGRFWFNMVPYLARHFRLVCPDLRGLGQSGPLQDPLRQMTVDNFIADIATVADHAGLETFHYVGESLAGGIGLMFAGQQPARLASVSVIAPGIYVNDWVRQAYAVGYPSWEDAMRTLGVAGWARKSNTMARFPPDIGDGFLDWYTGELANNDLEAMVGLVRAAPTVDARPWLKYITAPVLGLFPTSGQIATSELQQVLQDGVSDVRVVNIASPYQMLNLLRPAECAQAILAFAALQEGFVPRD